MTDLEGVAGVVDWDNKSGRIDEPDKLEQHYRATRWLTQEINAAVRGFFDGGATEVWVEEGHGGSIDFEEIDPRVRLIKGQYRPAKHLGLDETFAGFATVGTHSKAETFGGTLYHTSGKAIRGNWINGVSVGETGLQAFEAGWHGVPFIFCAGDAWACKEMEDLAPGCVTVPVKYGLSRHSAKTFTPARARELIYTGAAEAMKRTGQVKPLRAGPPVVFRIEWHEPHYDPADPPEQGRAVDSRTLEVPFADMGEMIRWGLPQPDHKPIWEEHLSYDGQGPQAGETR